MSVPSTVRARRALPPPLRAALVVGMLYSFLVGVSLLETGISGLGAGFQDGLVREIANPISGLFAGILLTVLVQSSSVSTATIVGLVGAGTLDVSLAVPMILGANIGTTMTALLASLAVDLRAGLVIALYHVLFNILGVALLYPVPAVRYIPVRLAERMGAEAARRRALVALYVFGLFVILPLTGIVVLR